ncbi:MAG: TolC family protein [Bdellovibrionaceae bacterium]|nr:TolC family protein [Pseudobdellovibrionaceae bacterium]
MKTFFVIVIFLILSLQARALTWNECVQLAQQNNLELQIADSNLTAAKQDTTIAQSNFYPHVFVTAAGNQTSLTDNVTNTYSAQIGFIQNIFSGFSDFYKTKQSDINFKIAQVNLQIAKAKLSAELKQSYETLLHVQSYLVLTQDIVRRRQDNLQNVQLRFNGGRENKGSVLLSQAYLSQARFEGLQARNQFTSAQENLARILGLANYVSLQVMDNRSIETHIPKIYESQYDDFVLNAPDYKLVQLQEKSADADVQRAHSGFYPSLDFSGSYGKTDSVFFPELNERWNLGLTLNIPLFDGGRDYASIKSAAAKWNVAAKNSESILKQLKNRIRNAYNDYIESLEKAQVDRVFKNAAEVRADIARNKYNNGLMTFDDWDVVENDFILRQKASLNSNRDSVFKEANWELIQGTGVIQ